VSFCPPPFDVDGCGDAAGEEGRKTRERGKSDPESSASTGPAAAADVTSRLDEDFVDVHQIGVGEFGSVYRCRHRLDGCTYAVKCSRKPLSVE
jgi:wee1-like protein kinase